MHNNCTQTASRRSGMRERFIKKAERIEEFNFFIFIARSKENFREGFFCFNCNKKKYFFLFCFTQRAALISINVWSYVKNEEYIEHVHPTLEAMFSLCCVCIEYDVKAHHSRTDKWRDREVWRKHQKRVKMHVAEAS